MKRGNIHLHIYPITLRRCDSELWIWPYYAALGELLHTEYNNILNRVMCCMRFSDWDLVLDDFTSIHRLHLSLNALLWLPASHSCRPLWSGFGIFLFSVCILFITSKHSLTDIHKFMSLPHLSSFASSSANQCLLCETNVKYFWPSRISSYIITACCSDFIRPMLSTCFPVHKALLLVRAI